MRLVLGRNVSLWIYSSILPLYEIQFSFIGRYVFQNTLRDRKHMAIYFLAFGPDLLASSVLDTPRSFRLKGSNAEDFTPPSGSPTAHPRPGLGGESRVSGPYLGRLFRGWRR